MVFVVQKKVFKYIEREYERPKFTISYEDEENPYYEKLGDKKDSYPPIKFTKKENPKEYE